MIRIYITLAVIIGIAFALIGSYVKGHSAGREAEALKQSRMVRTLNETIKLNEREAKERELARLQKIEYLETTLENLEEKANEDANADRPAISPEGVNRINTVP